jgi:hypothetical protein
MNEKNDEKCRKEQFKCMKKYGNGERTKMEWVKKG